MLAREAGHALARVVRGSRRSEGEAEGGIYNRHQASPWPQLKTSVHAGKEARTMYAEPLNETQERGGGERNGQLMPPFNSPRPHPLSVSQPCQRLALSGRDVSITQTTTTPLARGLDPLVATRPFLDK